jgi:hypothetical protein
MPSGGDGPRWSWTSAQPLSPPARKGNTPGPPSSGGSGMRRRGASVGHGDGGRCSPSRGKGHGSAEVHGWLTQPGVRLLRPSHHSRTPRQPVPPPVLDPASAGSTDLAAHRVRRPHVESRLDLFIGRAGEPRAAMLDAECLPDHGAQQLRSPLMQSTMKAIKPSGITFSKAAWSVSGLWCSPGNASRTKFRPDGTE